MALNAYKGAKYAQFAGTAVRRYFYRGYPALLIKMQRRMESCREDQKLPLSYPARAIVLF
ncbi:hypothetical protein CRP01_20635 [Flavilitoribacter nigricans DSM 23189 = NBRC 102662]|uniref:Uncharacterized protein n=1 Tax=Flavilitoribacter nigricans (strain ATCC 23147 / DSM 23189 / NBRC 102662 / NCIMB 1420 / SS-2) TaxID=1122177 RepID=A0A2D0N8E1_FLAN2|nr:hypothetical protein CRP01_20635 [Flavilitoribacter nigricans DSM 23189 = NBRC 102662]